MIDSLGTISGLPSLHQPDDHAGEWADIEAARAHPTAFAPLYRRYRDHVYAYIRTRTPNEEDASDLTQQVFLRALDALAQYTPHRGPFVAWLFGIARHMTVDFHRRQQGTVALDLLPPILQPHTEHGLDTAVLHREDIARLRAVFATLKPDQRELLVLRFVAQLGLAEIAAVIGKSEAATQRQLHRLMRTVKEHYHDDAR